MFLTMMKPNPFFAGLVFKPDKETGTGTQGDDTVASGDDTVVSGEDTTPADTTSGEDTTEGSLLDDTVKSGDDDTGSLLDDDDDDSSKGDTTPAETLDREAVKAAIPEGYKIENEEQFNEFLDLVEGAENRQDLAQKLLGLYNTNVDALEQKQVDEWNALQKQWKDDARNNPEFGGEKLQESLSKAKTLAKEFGGEEFLNLLKLTGASNHSSMISFLNKVYDALPQEAKPVLGNPKTAGELSLADKLFGGK
ncbi:MULTISPECIES: hypothetical protein [unclassified Roseobacter]|uniref:hypothetical protein n=1 Tax=unclassified Roseobacter TaxID=196798 RepID=UPI001490ED8A|nr:MULTISPECIES: hypothetical protein [unclassified Roseobacter]NNW55508.1 hypothetical protein [Roseobacter sp. HKCCD8284]NNY17305.1 hypothetical protein [Roseobacter sp. HKCCD8191]